MRTVASNPGNSYCWQYASLFNRGKNRFPCSNGNSIFLHDRPSSERIYTYSIHNRVRFEPILSTTRTFIFIAWLRQEFTSWFRVKSWCKLESNRWYTDVGILLNRLTAASVAEYVSFQSVHLLFQVCSVTILKYMDPKWAAVIIYDFPLKRCQNFNQNLEYIIIHHNSMYRYRYCL